MLSIYFSDYRTRIVVADKVGSDGLEIKGIYSARNRGYLPNTADGLLRNLGDHPSAARVVIDGYEVVKKQVDLPAIKRNVLDKMEVDGNISDVKKYVAGLFEKSESYTPASITVVDRELLADVSAVITTNKLSPTETLYGCESEVVLIDSLISKGEIDRDCLIVNVKGEYIEIAEYMDGERLTNRNVSYMIEGIDFLEDVIVETAIIENKCNIVYITGEIELPVINSIKAKANGKVISRIPLPKQIKGIDEFDFNAYIDAIGILLV